MFCLICLITLLIAFNMPEYIEFNLISKLAIVTFLQNMKLAC